MSRCRDEQVLEILGHAGDIRCTEPLRASSAFSVGGVDAARLRLRPQKRGETCSRREAPAARGSAKAGRRRRGSMPLLVPAMMLMVPVGAIVVTVAFLMALQLLSWDCSKSGKEPRPFPAALTPRAPHGR